MRFYTILLFFTGINSVQAQTTWTKADRNYLYDEVVSELVKYKNLTNEQRESIGLCCLESITAKYTKDVFYSKIEIEVERIKSSTIDQCSKNIGVNLTNTSQTKTSNITSENEWTKEDKMELVKNIMKYLDNYFNTEAEKETLALCFVNETSSKLSKNDYENMINLEQERHYKTTIEKCATINNIKIKSSLSENSENKEFNKKYLVGNWLTDQSYNILFNNDGTFSKKFNDNFVVSERYTYIKDGTVNGNWFLDENGNLTLTENWIEYDYNAFLKERRYSRTGKSYYKLISNTTDYFKIEYLSGSYCCKKWGTAVQTNIQANRIK